MKHLINRFLTIASVVLSFFVPGLPAAEELSPLVATRHYFDYLHTAADTLDKVEPENLRSQVATMATLRMSLPPSGTRLHAGCYQISKSL